MNAREEAIRTISENNNKAPLPVKTRSLLDFFGENVFNENVQRKRLTAEHFASLHKSIKMGAELDRSLADVVAVAMKNWALEKGATHFCHWFQPLTDLTAEKHDALFSLTEKGRAIVTFTGSQLIRGEPDASSFPSGGLRTTFEARGYTAWDPSSFAFIVGRTLVIPTVFISYLGDALDKKTPLLRSMESLNREALRILRLFGDRETQHIFSTVGPEQEYFLIDKNFYNLRPDLIACGRTLFGAKPPKGQELEDHYLGSIPNRILQIMEESEVELLRIGIPVQARHNEVAPSQYEVTVHYEITNVAVDHQMMMMEIMKSVALKHNMVCLLHEKPFANINGSGKHNNWSMATDKGVNLLDPGKNPHDNGQFLLFCAAVIRAIHLYGPLLRAGIASAGNDHRLGKHEAPPGIMSVFLGEQLFDIFERMQSGGKGKREGAADLKLGVSVLPNIPHHFSDRNRTSPFAFTGNKFEFRAVGSSENIAGPNTILNTIIADSLHVFANELEKAEKGQFNEALQSLLVAESKKFAPILFEGDNYHEDWHKEAAKRGLGNITNSVDALYHFTSEASINLFKRHGVYTKRELVARQEIGLDKYVKKIKVEALTASMMGHTQILPICFEYGERIGRASKYMGGEEGSLGKELAQLTSNFYKALVILDESVEKLALEEGAGRAAFARDVILPKMDALRLIGDKLEQILPDKLWPLPKYHEMLFIR